MRLRAFPLLIAVLLVIPAGLAQAAETRAAADAPAGQQTGAESAGTGDPTTVADALAEFEAAKRAFRGETPNVDAAPGASRATNLRSTLTSLDVDRIGGENRYDTAAQLSLSANDAYAALSGSDFPYVFLTTGLNYPDALAASAVQAPILLTARDTVPVETMDAIEQIDPDQVFIVGGTAAVSTQVEDQLINTGRAEVLRISGEDRYDTAAAISEMFGQSGGTVYLATGLNYPDALAAGPAAGVEDAPVLLTAKDTLPAATAAALEDLEPERIVVVGGPGAVSDAVLNEAAQYARLGAERRSGSDRYATAVAVGQPVFQTDAVWDIFMAKGTDFPDALAAGPAAYWWYGPVLLMQRTCTPAVVQNRIEELAPWYVTIVGGQAAIADGALDVTC